MSQGSLARELSRLERFSSPKLELEQYATPGELAAELLWNAHMRGEIEGKDVIDLGAGTGTLGIGALLLDAAHVTFVENDEDAVRILRSNLKGFAEERFTILIEDATTTKGTGYTIVMNPPFGAQLRHADRAFLQNALRSSGSIYSIHNANSKRFLERFCGDNGRELSIIGERSFPIPASFAHHTKMRQNSSVILVRIGGNVLKDGT